MEQNKIMNMLYNLPILKESGPPEVLLTHMAKKSRSAQAVSIFYDSSWVLPRGCPCHSHLKNIYRGHRDHTSYTSTNIKRDMYKSKLLNLQMYSTTSLSFTLYPFCCMLEIC